MKHLAGLPLLVSLFLAWIAPGIASASTIEFQGHQYVGMSDYSSDFFVDTMVGETRTLRLYDDSCVQRSKDPEVLRCGMTSEYHWNGSEFWSSSHDGTIGVPDYSETHFFTISFAPTYYLGTNVELVDIGDEYWKMLFDAIWWWSYDTAYGGNDYHHWPVFEASVVPAAVPLPASLPLLLAALGVLALRPRRR